MDELEIQRFGPRGLLVKFANEISEAALCRGRGLMHYFETHPLEGVTDIVPAYGEVLLEFREDISDWPRLERELTHGLRNARALPGEEARLHEIPVRYDGPDLADLAAAKGLSVSEVVEIHSAPVYSVYQIGFTPGFPYLGTLDPRLHMPRLGNPRPRVEAGSVGIGGEQTGIYPIASAAGWRLIGRTEVELFRRDRGLGEGSEEAFLLRSGDRVKFIPIA